MSLNAVSATAPTDSVPHLSSSESELVMSSLLDEDSCLWEMGTWEEEGERGRGRGTGSRSMSWGLVLCE